MNRVKKYFPPLEIHFIFLKYFTSRRFNVFTARLGVHSLSNSERICLVEDPLRSLKVVRGHYKVKHWIGCCHCIPLGSSFRLIYIPWLLVKVFSIWDHERSLGVIIRSNTGLVAATVFPWVLVSV